MDMQCPRCQHENPLPAKLCRECGTLLTLACLHCGTQLPASARFCLQCGRPVGGSISSQLRYSPPESYTPKHLAEKILTSKHALEGERKQVTVLFADVENFTGLGFVLDPEELHELMDQVFALVLAVIHQYDGTVNQFTGDGVMALFGAPVALEGHAFAAVAAALEIQERMQAAAEDFVARWSRAPVLRIGINTGRVVVGKIGDDLRMDYTAQGDTVNLAARLQAMAEPGTVAISAATHRSVSNVIECESLGLRAVKGREKPVEVWRAVRALHHRSRPAVSATAELSPFIGRTGELDRLLELLELARAGQPGVAVITGEAGVGKTRLLFELRGQLPGGEWPVGEWRWFEAHCVPYGRTTPYRPIVEMLRSTFGLTPTDSGEVAGQKLEKLLRNFGEERSLIEPAVRHLLRLGPAAEELALLSPTDRKAMITRALDRLTRSSTEAAPQVFVFEDCEWMDSASKEYLLRLCRQLGFGRALFIFTYRPDDDHPTELDRVGTRFALRPLVPSHSESLIRHLAGGSLSDELMTIVIDRTGGNPLFIEELTRVILESDAPATTLKEVPPTIAEVLTARVDRLPPAAKSVLQVASVLGRRFSQAALEQVADVSDAATAYTTLTDFGLIARQESQAGWYIFRHGLLQETVYEGLLHQRRRVLHRRSGEVLEKLYQGRLAEYVDGLARHFVRGEDWARAVHYLGEAARKAAALCANTEAVHHFEQALAAVSRLPETLERTQQTIDLYLEMRPSLLQLGRLDDVRRVSREAESLSQALGDQERLLRVYTYLINYHYMRGEPDLAVEYGERCQPEQGRPDVTGVQPTARQYIATSYHVLGQYEMAEELLSQNVADLERSDAFTRSGPDNLLYVSSCGWRAFALAETGDFSAAHLSAAKGVHAADLAGYAYARAIARSMAGLVSLSQGVLDRALPELETALDLCGRHHLIVWTPIPSSLLGKAYALVDKVEQGLELLHEATAQTDALGINAYRALWQVHLGEALLAAGDRVRALDVAHAALDSATRYKEAGHHARALLLLGQIHLEGGPDSLRRAEELLQQSLLEAERLRMRPLVGHCYVALGALARRRGIRDRATDHLTTATAMFRSLHMPFWLERAESLLKTLA
jgi:class 3 adenylate cyclase/tetratricopeptide (TPR) repeat protein/ribosomal protein L40E